MITTASLMLALCLALPTGLAQPGGQAPPQDTPTEPGAEEQPQQPQQPQGQQPQEQQQQQPESKEDMKMKAQVEASVRTAALGVQMGDAAIDVLNQMASLQPLERGSVREVVALVDQGIETATDNTKELHKMKDLPEQERTQAKHVIDKLDEAHATVRQMRRQVGAAERELEQEQVQSIRTHTMRLQGNLDEAKQVIEQIANAHQIQLEMEPQERSAAR